jgi:hypothetical protein
MLNVRFPIFSMHRMMLSNQPFAVGLFDHEETASFATSPGPPLSAGYYHFCPGKFVRHAEFREARFCNQPNRPVEP